MTLGHTFLAILAFLVTSVFAAAPGDAQRGARLLESLKCNQCHSFVPRWSDGLPPALARLFKTQLTPSRFAQEMWNHAPLMWTAIQSKQQPFPAVSDQQAADLITWFFAAGYFDPAGDARRGEKVFTKGGCHVCHLMESDQGGGVAVAKWSITNYTDLLQGIWSHWPAMDAAMGRRRLVWPSVDAGGMRDLLAFAQSRFPGSRNAEMGAGSVAAGMELFKSKGCAACHSGEVSLNQYPGFRSFTELAASFWNHVPMMTRAPAPITRPEMADIVAFLWSVRYFEGAGNARRGGQVFQAKRCSECHSAVARGDFQASSMIAALWKHSPDVIEQMRRKTILWPKFTVVEMEDLIAFYASTIR